MVWRWYTLYIYRVDSNQFVGHKWVTNASLMRLSSCIAYACKWPREPVGLACSFSLFRCLRIFFSKDHQWLSSRLLELNWLHFLAFQSVPTLTINHRSSFLSYPQFCRPSISIKISVRNWCKLWKFNFHFRKVSIHLTPISVSSTLTGTINF